MPKPINELNMSAEDARTAIVNLQKRIGELESISVENIQTERDIFCESINAKVHTTLEQIFGEESKAVGRFSVYRLDDFQFSFFGKTPLVRIRSGYKKGIGEAILKLQTLVQLLEERIETDACQHPAMPAPQRARVLGRQVFVVHGHDESAKEQVARFLERLGLEPIILHEQVNKGRTIIEKFESFADVDFAIVLLTPDDLGRSASEHSQTSLQELSQRARQNVILELGFFIGKLGRGRVAALTKGAIEIPSDYDGVIYTEMDIAGGWKAKIGQELKQTGIDVDLNKITS